MADDDLLRRIDGGVGAKGAAAGKSLAGREHQHAERGESDETSHGFTSLAAARSGSRRWAPRCRAARPCGTRL